ncbi:hypothetical protein DYB31_013409, partial [Aphanomyces astaci]
MKVAAVLSLSAAVAHAKVSVGVLRSLETTGTSDVLISFVGADLESLAESKHEDRRQAVYDALTAHSATTRTESASVLDSADCEHFWIAPAAICRGLTKEKIDQVARLPNVKSVAFPDNVQLIEPVLNEELSVKAGEVNATVPQWGVTTTGAPD